VRGGAVAAELAVLELDARKHRFDGQDARPDQKRPRWSGGDDAFRGLGRHGERAQEGAEVHDVDVAGLLRGEHAVEVELDAAELAVARALVLQHLVREARDGEPVPVDLNLLGELRRVEQALDGFAGLDVHERAARRAGIERHRGAPRQ